MYYGKHREDQVGSPRYSDEDCLISERIGKRVAEQVKENRCGTPDCESH